MSTYAGESIAKKVCRVRVYRRAREALRSAGVNLSVASAVFLPGPEASEVGALKHILGFRAEQCFAIDRDASCIQAAKDRWPGVNTLQGDLEDPTLFNNIISRMNGQRASAFTHLDLMGNLSLYSEYNYGLWSQFSCPYGVVAVTYLRGREGKNSFGQKGKDDAKTCIEILKAEGARRELRLLSADPERAASHATALVGSHIRTALWSRMKQLEQVGGHEAIEVAKNVLEDSFSTYSDTGEWSGFIDDLNDNNTPIFRAIGSHAYRADVSPMGVVMAQLLPYTVSPLIKKMQSHFSRDTTSIIKKDPMDDLLAEADSLEKEFTKQQVAEILNVSTGTLAAWRAHRTMGTYS